MIMACAASAERTRDFVEPGPSVLKMCGITRVGDLTGLDCLGVPVWFACRPNARALSVSQGKGLTHRQARISAIMEAIESAMAERPRTMVESFCSLNEAARNGLNPVPLERLARCDARSLDPDRERAWVPGRSLFTGESVVAPFELVGLDLRLDAPWDRDAFRMTSHGLGAGSDRESATEHALMELIEHDASSMTNAFGLHAGGGRPLRYETGVRPQLDEIVGRLGARGLTPRFLGVRSKVPVPVVGAFVPHPIMSERGPILRYVAGYAAREDLWQAAEAALLEAIQSRLTVIAGSRDDLTAAEYEVARAIEWRDETRSVDMKAFAQSIAPLSPPFSLLSESHILSRLGDAGIKDAFAFELTPRDSGFAVVRVLVPGLGAASGQVSFLDLEDVTRLVA